jgi:putrescine transport system substrate-binding protein
MYLALNKSLLTNYKNLDPEMLKSLSEADPQNKYFVPWAAGYTTLFLNMTKVRQALGGMPLPDNEWDLVFKPEYTQRLKKCGIAFLDSPSEIIPLAMHYMGLNPYSENQADYGRATELLRPVRRDVRTFSLSMIGVMSSGSVCTAIAWAGDINTSILALREQGVKDELVGIQPKFGTLKFVDVLAIPVNALHPRNAHAFIDFYLKAANAARMPNEVGYANGNLAALEFVNADIQKNPLIYPPAKFASSMPREGGYSDKARWGMMNAYMSFAYDLKQ